MTKQKFAQFTDFLLKQNKIIAPQYDVEGVLHLAELNDSKDLYFGNELPLDSWKWYMLPPDQTMFKYKKDKMLESLPDIKPQIFLGVSILDMQALTLLNLVYEDDPYYQAIRKKTLVIGTSLVPKENLNKYLENFEENKLEHLNFDIFLAVQKTGYKYLLGLKTVKDCLINLVIRTISILNTLDLLEKKV